MKEKILYISDRPSMGADMLIKNLNDTFEIMWVRSSDDVDYEPKIILVNLAGLESSEKVKNFKNVKIFLLGNQTEINNSDIKGAEFFVRPFNANEIREKLSELSKNDTEAQKILLLVDDDAVMLKTLREGLSTSYKVIPANGGANALKILERAKPDLILLDYEMPSMNGPEVLEKIKSNSATADIPVMFLTAKTDVKLEEKHMLKTLPLKEIKMIIQNFLINSENLV